MRIGYACVALAVPGSGMKSCMLKNASPERLLALIEQNLNALEKLIDYNIHNDIALFRISSDLIPFGSSVAAKLPWDDIYAEKLSAIGEKILRAGMRVSMHPGQYTVLNSPDALVSQRAAEDLQYHTRVLDRLGSESEHKIILHLGGVYGDKKTAKARFIQRCRELEPSVLAHLVLENDDKLFDIRDVLEISAATGLPAVYDNLHNALNPADEAMNDPDWIRLASATWKRRDGGQKIHYSQQHPDKRPGAHSETIQVDAFLQFLQSLAGIDVDIMLEVKDKNLSTLKCINCISNRGIGALEAEWGHYKYCVLERSSENYLAIRALLKDKSAYPASEMYGLIEASMAMPVNPGNAVNAAQHVWGYFKDRASEAEKKRFSTLLQKFAAGEAWLEAIKNYLALLADKYREDYLLQGYYFYT